MDLAGKLYSDLLKILGEITAGAGDKPTGEVSRRALPAPGGKAPYKQAAIEASKGSPAVGRGNGGPTRGGYRGGRGGGGPPRWPRANNPKTGECHQCHQIGHWKNECPNGVGHFCDACYGYTSFKGLYTAGAGGSCALCVSQCNTKEQYMQIIANAITAASVFPQGTT